MLIYNINDVVHDINYIDIFNLLKQLTDAPILERDTVNKIVSELPANHNIFILLNENKKVIGMITLIIEQKLIHGGKCVGHIEDFVVDKMYRGNKIGGKMLDYCKEYAKKNNCYKIILDCNDNMRVFYERNSLTHTTNGMSLYF